MTGSFLNLRHSERLYRWYSDLGIVAVLLFTVILTGPGCALLGPQSGKQTDPHAQDIINRIQAFNAQISTSKVERKSIKSPGLPSRPTACA